jgi:hypothetical protein
VETLLDVLIQDLIKISLINLTHLLSTIILSYLEFMKLVKEVKLKEIMMESLLNLVQKLSIDLVQKTNFI